MLNAFSIDVEDWYQSSYDFDAPISSLCYRNTQKVLDILKRFNVKGTFFVQGMVAKKFPDLLKEIDKNGHDVESHGFSHKPVNQMTHKQFYDELTETSKIIEDTIGKPVEGFRAPDFSIDQKSWWAFDVMVEAGIKYDSSIFPMKTNRYGVSGFKAGYSKIETQSGTIDELTVSVLDLSGFRIPVCGGGYIRLLPESIINYAVRKINYNGNPFVIYCHPYEFNHSEWRHYQSFIPGTRKLHQGIGRKRFPSKIKSIIKKKKFTKIKDVISYLKN